MCNELRVHCYRSSSNEAFVYFGGIKKLEFEPAVVEGNFWVSVYMLRFVLSVCRSYTVGGCIWTSTVYLVVWAIECVCVECLWVCVAIKKYMRLDFRFNGRFRKCIVQCIFIKPAESKILKKPHCQMNRPKIEV